jgi:predicted nucleic-acid-binding Zn-ribbon protein
VSQRGSMTTLRQIDLSCPACGNSFQSQVVVSTNVFGGKRTDFHERVTGTQPLAYLVHMCRECGYSGTERDFTGLYGTLRDFTGLYGTLRDFTGLHGTLRDFTGLYGTLRDFTGVTDVSPMVRAHVLAELTSKAPFSITGSAKYEATAKVAEWQAIETRQVA